MKDTYIIGAGLAGLITACRIKDVPIYEASQRAEQHKALLRFRDESVSTVTGIPFKPVRVDKAIWYNGKLLNHCNLIMANNYSYKVTGTYSGRSIWNMDSVTRYIAPESFYDQLVDRAERRIEWKTSVESIARGNKQKTINTAPLPIIMDVCGLDRVGFDFHRKAIRVDRYRLPHGSDIYQTVYFPEGQFNVFRASITGDVLIVESIIKNGVSSDAYDAELVIVCQSFGIGDSIAHILESKIESVNQKYGKIVDLPREQREAILYELTRDFNVFSIGRFATWRNILLDDVVKDIGVVERLLAASEYGRELVLANR